MRINRVGIVSGDKCMSVSETSRIITVTLHYNILLTNIISRRYDVIPNYPSLFLFSSFLVLFFKIESEGLRLLYRLCLSPKFCLSACMSVCIYVDLDYCPSLSVSQRRSAVHLKHNHTQKHTPHRTHY